MTTLYTVHLPGEPTENRLIMIAPMRTLERALNLHPAAVARIEFELENGDSCELHNGRRFSPSGTTDLVVRRFVRVV